MVCLRCDGEQCTGPQSCIDVYYGNMVAYMKTKALRHLSTQYCVKHAIFSDWGGAEPSHCELACPHRDRLVWIVSWGVTECGAPISAMAVCVLREQGQEV